MRIIKHAFISFGLVDIPVGVAGVKTGTNDPTFRTLHSKCGNPIHQTNHCDFCGEDAEETVKGFEVAKGQFVTFTEEELASVAADRGTTIELTKFIRAVDVKPLMIDKSYWLVPPENEKRAEKYGLLYQSLAETKKAGLGSESLWGKEFPCVVVPNQDYASGVLQMHVLHPLEDLIAPDFSAPIPGREEKKMAKEIIEKLTSDFDPEKDLVTVTRTRTNELIAARMEDKELPVFGGVEVPDEDSDLMGALRASVAEIEKKKSPAKKAPAKRRAAVKK